MISVCFGSKNNRILAFLLCAISSSGFAAKPIDLSKEVLPLLQESHQNLTANNQSNAPLRVIKSNTDINQVTHVRVQQMHANYPVWGADAVLHMAPSVSKNATLRSDNDVIHLLNTNPRIKKNGIYYAEINKDLGNTVPQQYLENTAQQSAITVLKQSFLKFNSGHAWDYQNEKADLMVYVDEENKSHWVYRVSFTAITQNKIPVQPIALIDVTTHEIYKEWNNIKHEKGRKLEPAIAFGYGGNPLLGKWQYGKDKPGLAIRRSSYSSVCYMKNDDVKIIKYLNYNIDKPGLDVNFPCPQTTPSQTEFFESEKGLLGQTNDAYSPLNDALYAGMIIKNMYTEWYGLPVLTLADGKTPLLLSMNLFYADEGFENAFWNSDTKKMYFGLGGKEFYPLVTLGIAAHEISHGFTDQHSDLIYEEQSGALNESFSDMASVASSYYESHGNDIDWNIGAEVVKDNLGKDRSDWLPIRYINTPARDNYSIEKVEDYPNLQKLCRRASRGDREKYHNCVVHLASGVFNKAFYNLATSDGWNPKLAFGVMIKANQDYWTASATFASAACGVKSAAMDLEKSNALTNLAAIDKAFEGVGISIASCGQG